MTFAATWMQLEIIILSEISQKERQIPYDITYIWNIKMAQMNLSTNRNRLTDLENRLVVANGERVEGIGYLGLVDANCYI